jgi:hypothetical protein
VSVGPAASFPEGTARAVDVPGAFVGRVGGRLVAVLQADGCSLSVRDGRYRDCRGTVYDLRGNGASGCGGLRLLAVEEYRGTVYIDPDHPVGPTPAAPDGSSC